MVAAARGGLTVARAQVPAGAARPARIAVMPAFNEAPTIEGVLDDLYPRVDHLIIVDDGSADETGAIVDGWAATRPRVRVIHFRENRGLSAALRAGWDEVRGMLTRGEVRPDDVAFSIDADGQHEPAALDGMIDHLVRGNYDCVIGSRDLSYHTGYKKLGNAAMTRIGRLSGGYRFEDIECGYRVFRVGPLLDAQQFYRGYKYSETVEVAVLLARMGYRVDNTCPINIPVARTRTRLFDAAVDAVCMPLSWYRLLCWRDMPAALRSRFALWLPVPVLVLTFIALVLMAVKSFYLGDDSAHSYAHVWYLSESIFTRHEWPWHIAQLENGEAVMFPYGIIPWLPSALFYPLLGDWVVTASMVLGTVLLLAGVLRFRPAMRSPVLLALFLLNPFFWNGLTQFQLTSFWSFALFFFGASEFERGHRAKAVLLLALAIAAHPAMGSMAIALYAAWEAGRTRSFPARLVVVGAIAGALASPAIVLFVSTPALHDQQPLTLALSFLDNLRRLSIPLAALGLPAIAQWAYRSLRLVALTPAAVVTAVLIAVPPSGLWEQSQPRYDAYLQEYPVDPAISYRVAMKNNHEDGMVQLMKRGATISHEFFTESERRQAFASLDAYMCLLATRDVRRVILTGDYPGGFYRNEKGFLDQMVALGMARPQFAGADGTVAYEVHPPGSARRQNLRDCHL